MFLRIFKSFLAIFSESVILILFVIWFLSSHDYEPLIGLIISFMALFSSLSSRFLLRPKLVLSKEIGNSAKLPLGIVEIESRTVTAGDFPIQSNQLYWTYELTIRNNSSYTAYNIDFEFENLPIGTQFLTTMKANEPILANDSKSLSVKIVQHFVGHHAEANELLTGGGKEYTQDFRVKVKFEDESGIKYKCLFKWNENQTT